MFERVIGLEERLDDLEENTRKIMKELAEIKSISEARPKRVTTPASKKKGA